MSYALNVSLSNHSVPGRAAGELAILQRLRERTRRHNSGGLSLGIGDDCALLRLRAGEEAAVTTDLSIESRHFRLDWHSPESVGHRTLARGLSDLAAMGARPVAAFLSLGVPRTLTEKHRGLSWVDRFLEGFLTLADRHKTPLAGGDLAEAPLAMADIVLVGAVPGGQAMLRSQAKPGDILYVTGSLGGSAMGLKYLKDQADSAPKTGKKFPAAQPSTKALRALLAPHLYPEPRIPQGIRLRKFASAALDISDGLSTDLRHLCEESGVAAEIFSSALPLGTGTTLNDALHGGEDYELLFTAPESARVPRSIQGVPLTAIGRILRARKSQPQIFLQTPEGRRPLTGKGWEHFS